MADDHAFDDERDHASSDETDLGRTLDEIEEEDDLMDLAVDLKYGGDRGEKCTYPKGYVKRQVLFSCLTCVPDGNAGICLACAVHCHEDHKIVVMRTRRKFRCDCGNSKFGVFYCKLSPNKDPENADNSYNQNFKGYFCTCRHYTLDPDTEEEAEMIQCCICEHLFHVDHIGHDSSEEIPRNEEGDIVDFICQDCAPICSFVNLYGAEENVPEHGSSTYKYSVKDESHIHVSASVMKNAKENVPEHVSSGFTYVGKDENDIYDSAFLPKCLTPLSETKNPSNEKDSLHGENTVKEMGLENTEACYHDAASSSKCIIGVDLSATSLVLEQKYPIFLEENWRDLLCRCITCCEFYKKKGIDDIIDEEDSMKEYHKIALQKREERLQREKEEFSNLLNNLGHVGKIEYLTSLKDLVKELISYWDVHGQKPMPPEDMEVILEKVNKKRKRRMGQDRPYF